MRDLLLQLTTYPDPTPDWAIEAAASIAEHFGARLSAAVCQVSLPEVSIVLDKLVGVNAAVAAENSKSRQNGERLLSRFAEIVAPEHAGEHVRIDCITMVSSLQLARRTRLADLTILPRHGGSQALAEDLVFDSGRPLLLLSQPEGASQLRFDEVVVGWDGGRAAARALADALPICIRARSVKVVTITGEKQVEQELQAPVHRHLRTHGIEAQMIEHPAADGDAGAALLDFCRRSAADLLVAGAYGHSHFREFILGGATRTILAEADLPVLIAH